MNEVPAGSGRRPSLAEVQAACVVRPTAARAVVLHELDRVSDGVKAMLASREAERVARETADPLMDPAAAVTGCVLLEDDHHNFSGIVTYRDLVQHLPAVQHYGQPLKGSDVLLKIATRGGAVRTLCGAHTVNYLFHYMIPTGYGFRHVPFLDRRGRPSGVFQLKELLRYAIWFLEEHEDQTPLSYLRLGELKQLLLEPHEPLRSAVEMMNATRRRCVLVVKHRLDTNSWPLGIVSEWDAIRACLLEGRSLETPVSEVMQANPHGSPVDSTVLDAARHMLRVNHHQIIIERKGPLVGLLGLRDVLDHAAGYFAQDVYCIDPADPDDARYRRVEGA